MDTPIFIITAYHFQNREWSGVEFLLRRESKLYGNVGVATSTYLVSPLRQVTKGSESQGEGVGENNDEKMGDGLVKNVHNFQCRVDPPFTFKDHMPFFYLDQCKVF